MLAMQAAVSAQEIDDLYWRSDASSGAWLGDIRCYTRMPASDQSVQFSRTPGTTTAFFNTSSSVVGGPAANVIWFMNLAAPMSGLATAALASFGAAVTGHVNMALYDNSGPTGGGQFANGSPGVLLAQGTPITNPGTGLQTFTFGTPAGVTRGTQYWVAMFADATLAAAINGTTLTLHASLNFTYSSGVFPASALGAGTLASTSGFGYVGFQMSPGNYATVAEPQQDAATSYVYDSTPGDADFYGIASIASTPVATIAVTTRGYMQKSDAGTRTAAVQLKSGASTVASPTLTLTTSGWQWAWRTDTIDPNTSAAWTAAAVNNAQYRPEDNRMTDTRATQASLEHWLTTNPDAQITQVALEHWATVTGTGLQAVVTQVALEHWASVAVVPSFVNGPIITMIG